MTSRNMKISVFTVLVILLCTMPSFSQDLSELNDAAKTQQSGFKELALTIINYLSMASVLFLVSNLIFNYTQSKPAYATAIIILIIKGIFSLIY